MLMVGVILLSLLSCAVQFAWEIALGNIGQAAQGRPPKAGAALFPVLPMVPLTYVTALWLASRYFPDTGPVWVFAWGGVSILVRVALLVRARARLRKMMGG